MKADAIADQTGLALTLVESYMAEADNGKRPFDPPDPADRIAEIQAMRDAAGIPTLPKPVEQEYIYSSADLPMGPPEE